MRTIIEQIQDKTHIIITGKRGSGKSTLLREIIAAGELGASIPGIITWCEPGKAVYMHMTGNDNNIVIGTFNPDSTGKENRMCPVRKGFDESGVVFLEHLIADSSEWVLIDEIGYLENSSVKYIEQVKQLFEKKRVLAVVRKQETELINYILNRKDVLVIDLDVIA